MKHHHLKKCGATSLILMMLVGMLALPDTAMAAYSASDVLGQGDFTTGTANTTVLTEPNKFGLFSVEDAVLDPVGHRLFVADSSNHRVLEFDLDTDNVPLDYAADHVLGQPDFVTKDANATQNGLEFPVGLAYDSANQRLFVVDDGNNRVVVFAVSTITDGENAVNVIGQMDYTSSGSALTQNGLYNPSGVAYDATDNRLFVAELGNSRVVVYDVDPAVLIPNNAGTDGPNAVNVIGSPDFTTSPGGINQQSLNVPYFVAYDSNNKRLFVAEEFNNRVTVFDVDPAVLIANNAGTDGPNAINVIGQTNFTSNGHTLTQGGLWQPVGVGYDSNNERLFVADGSNNRITVYDVDPAVLIANNAGTDGPNAINVIGQPDFVSNTIATTQSGVNIFGNVGYDADNEQLFAADSGNHRITVYNVDPAVLIANNSGTDGPNAINAIGQTDGVSPIYTTSQRDDLDNSPISQVSNQGFSSPVSTTLDAVHHRLFVVDVGNHRVLEFDLDSDNNLLDDTADHVLGQDTFEDSASALTQDGFNSPLALAYDSVNDRLFVAEFDNDRVVVFDTSSITDGENAINVIGQADYTTNGGTITQKSLLSPTGLVYDSSTDWLFVVDRDQNRIMVFDADPTVLIADTPATDNPDAIHVLGHTLYDNSDTPTEFNGFSAEGLALDVSGQRLFVGDELNNRVLVFNVSSITNGENATNLLGHTAYDGSDTPTGQNGFITEPVALAYDATHSRLFVSDDGAHRVTVFDVASITNGENATAVIGQDDFTTSTPGTTQDTFDTPAGMAYDGGNNRLYVADIANNRVMIFNLVTVSPDTLPDGSVSVLYSQTISADNAQGTVAFAITSGSVPTGLSLNTTTGELSGIPTATGSFSFTVTATDDISPAGSFTDSQAYTISIGLGPYLASDALGQIDENGDAYFTSDGPDNGPSEKGFSAIWQSVIDTTDHHLFVVDQGNNRVLVFNLNTSNILTDRSADYVLGQSSFKTNDSAISRSGMNVPVALAYDSDNDRLFVGDAGTQRVLVFDVSSITNGENAINVIGKETFTASGGTASRSNLVGASGLAYDAASQRLFVSDQNARRVLVFDVDPAVLIANDASTDGPDAINIIGKTSYTDDTGGTTRKIFQNGPFTLAYDSHDRLFVGDAGNNRVIVFDVDPAVLIANNAGTDGPDAINVIGQVNYGTGTAGLTRKKFSSSTGVSYDATNDRLFVADSGNSRVLVFDVDPAVLIANNSATDGPDAINVIGQTNYTTGTSSTTQSGISQPDSIFYESGSKQLWVSENANERLTVFDADPAVLIANDSGSDGPLAVDALGQLDENDDPYYTSGNADNAPNAQGLSAPGNAAIDTIHHRLFVAEQDNNRVVVFNLDSDNNLIDRTADRVLGQPDLKSNGSGTAQNSFSFALAVTYDSTNNRLFVADAGNARVLVFDVSSITNGENAINVIGHTTYDNSDSPGVQNSVGDPFGLAYDATNERLFVGDQNGERVMVFDVDPAVLIANNTGTDGPNAINELGHTAYDGSDTPTDENGVSAPSAIAYDTLREWVFVSDGNNARVMVFDADPAVLIANNSATDGPDAIHLLGHTAYDGSDTPTEQNGIPDAQGLALDNASHRLFVAGGGSNRITIFDVESITDGENAVAVLGQPDFSTTDSGTTQAVLNFPAGVVYNPANNRLYVSDQANSRVLIYDFVHLSTSDPADGTVGQAYDEELVTSGDQGDLTFSVVSGSLPPGLILGSISGTPTTAGVYTFTIRATDDNGAIGSFFDDQTYTMTIAAGATPTPPTHGGGGGTPTPTPTPSVSPSPSVTPTPSASPSATPTPGLTPTPSVSGSPVPSGSPAPSLTPAPSVSASPAPTGTPGPSALPPVVGPIISAVGSTIASAFTAIIRVLGGAIPVVAPVVALAAAIPILIAALVAALTTGSPVSFALSQSRVLMEVIGLKRRRRIWGSIYDSRTKRPIPYAKVELYDQNRRLLETRYADRDGRYGFLTSPQSLHQDSMQIIIVPSALGYTFPSQTVTGSNDFIVYDHLYRGETVTIAKDMIVNYNIALDPAVSTPTSLPTRAPSIFGSTTVILLNIAFWVGIIALPINAIRSPSVVSISLLAVFLIANGIRISSDLYRPYGLVTDSHTHLPVPYALVTVSEPNGKRLSFAVSDERGRYFLIISPGTYLITVYTPAQVQPPRTSSVLLTTKRGWIRRGMGV